MINSSSPTSQHLVTELTRIVGRNHLLTDPQPTERYRKGFRSGTGDALAVVLPGTLLEQWRILQACVAAEVIILMQAANTELTEGSTPNGNDYPRDIIIMSTVRLDKIQLPDGGKQVLALHGSTLYQLEKILKPLGREPHSVIGFSCIGASVLGGICNNSGASLIKRGPAFSEMALFAQIDASGKLKLVNHPGIDLGITLEHILARLDDESWQPHHVQHDNRCASDGDYAQRVQDVEADTPSRFNADLRRLFEASGCAGKLAVFAVRLDTFISEKVQQVFYIGTDRPEILDELRRHIPSHFTELPVAAEYLHRDAFDIEHVYGKDISVMIDKLGTDKMPLFFNLKGRMDVWLSKIGFCQPNLIDRLLQKLSVLLPEHLPERLLAYRDRYQHHLMLKMAGPGVAEALHYL